ncbi:hypothetical protein [Halovulum sp. GXIMD14793]
MKPPIAALMVLAIGAGPATAQTEKRGLSLVSKIDCYCTDTQGTRREMGEEICLYVDGRAYMARCVMALNTPFWKDIGDGCPSASLARGGRGGDGFILYE